MSSASSSSSSSSDNRSVSESPSLIKMHSTCQKRQNKPLIEKRRRARINDCLLQLKTIIMTDIKTQTPRPSKLEKADILEMTVDYIKKMAASRTGESTAKEGWTERTRTATTARGEGGEDTGGGRAGTGDTGDTEDRGAPFLKGFSRCLREVDCFLLQQLPQGTDVRRKLLTHCATQLSAATDMETTDILQTEGTLSSDLKTSLTLLSSPTFTSCPPTAQNMSWSAIPEGRVSPPGPTRSLPSAYPCPTSERVASLPSPAPTLPSASNAFPCAASESGLSLSASARGPLSAQNAPPCALQEGGLSPATSLRTSDTSSPGHSPQSTLTPTLRSSIHGAVSPGETLLSLSPSSAQNTSVCGTFQGGVFLAGPAYSLTAIASQTMSPCSFSEGGVSLSGPTHILLSSPKMSMCTKSQGGPSDVIPSSLCTTSQGGVSLSGPTHILPFSARSGQRLSPCDRGDDVMSSPGHGQPLACRPHSPHTTSTPPTSDGDVSPSPSPHSPSSLPLSPHTRSPLATLERGLSPSMHRLSDRYDVMSCEEEDRLGEQFSVAEDTHRARRALLDDGQRKKVASEGDRHAGDVSLPEVKPAVFEPSTPSVPTTVTALVTPFQHAASPNVCGDPQFIPSPLITNRGSSINVNRGSINDITSSNINITNSNININRGSSNDNTGRTINGSVGCSSLNNNNNNSSSSSSSSGSSSSVGSINTINTGGTLNSSTNGSINDSSNSSGIRLAGPLKLICGGNVFIVLDQQQQQQHNNIPGCLSSASKASMASGAASTTAASKGANALASTATAASTGANGFAAGTKATVVAHAVSSTDAAVNGFGTTAGADAFAAIAPAPLPPPAAACLSTPLWPLPHTPGLSVTSAGAVCPATVLGPHPPALTAFPPATGVTYPVTLFHGLSPFPVVGCAVSGVSPAPLFHPDDLRVQAGVSSLPLSNSSVHSGPVTLPHGHAGSRLFTPVLRLPEASSGSGNDVNNNYNSNNIMDAHDVWRPW